MKGTLAMAGHPIDVVAINSIGAESTQELLSARCTFDLLQDVAAVGAWSLLGGGKDDFFIYREKGALAPGGYLAISGPINTNLSTTQGYQNVFNAIVAADSLGPGKDCGGSPGGMQLPGDANQDAVLDVSDAITLLGYFFLGDPAALPCEGGTPSSEGNRELLDLNLDAVVDLTDAVHALEYLFLGGPPPGLGVECRPIAGCPEKCGS